MAAAKMFERLSEELDRWDEQGLSPRFWWRDDDVQRPGAALERLLNISSRWRMPLALASIPRGVDTGLAEVLRDFARVHVLLHGYSHQSHAPASERNMELGGHRPCGRIRAEIEQGLHAFQELFGAQFVPVLVPPWNRIHPEVLECLAQTEILGLSTLGPRKQDCPLPGILQANVHVDIMNWKQGRRFAGLESCIDQLLRHLDAKRLGRADRQEPTGIMSHHLVHDEACWAFLEDLFAFLHERPGVQVESASTLFAGARRR